MHGHVLLFLCGCWGFTPSFPHSKSKHSYPMRHLPSLCPALLNALAGCYEFLFLDSLPNDRTLKLRSQLLLCVESLNFDLSLSNQTQASRSLCRSPQLEDTDTSIAGIDGMGIGRLVVAINFLFLRPFLRFWTSLGDWVVADSVVGGSSLSSWDKSYYASRLTSAQAPPWWTPPPGVEILDMYLHNWASSSSQ